VTSLNSSPPNYSSFALSFEVVSEDLNGSGPQAALLLDFQGLQQSSNFEQLGDVRTLPPGHLTSACTPADCTETACICNPSPKRPVAWESIPLLGHSLTSGCHSITAVVSHRFSGFQPVPLIQGDLATATWLFNLKDPLGQPTEEGTCLTGGLSTGDAGASAGVSP